MHRKEKKTLSLHIHGVRQANDQCVLLCHAGGMFPDLVRLTWQAEDQRGRKVEVKDNEWLEQRDKDQIQIISMLIVEEYKAMNNQAAVQHDCSFKDKIISKR